MSPARARTSLPEIVAAARDLLEADGPEAVTMLVVGERVGVRGPSLYKWIPSRGALLAEIGAATLDDLAREIDPLSRNPDPAAGLRAIATAYRAFAHAHPRSYELLFLNQPTGARPPVERFAIAADPVIALAAQLVGTERALEAARLITAFAHGFVSMELTGAFRLGGDVDRAYDYGVSVLVEALVREGSSGRPSSG